MLFTSKSRFEKQYFQEGKHPADQSVAKQSNELSKLSYINKFELSQMQSNPNRKKKQISEEKLIPKIFGIT